MDNHSPVKSNAQSSSTTEGRATKEEGNKEVVAREVVNREVVNNSPSPLVQERRSHIGSPFLRKSPSARTPNPLQPPGTLPLQKSYLARGNSPLAPNSLPPAEQPPLNPAPIKQTPPSPPGRPPAVPNAQAFVVQPLSSLPTLSPSPQAPASPVPLAQRGTATHRDKGTTDKRTTDKATTFRDGLATRRNGTGVPRYEQKRHTAPDYPEHIFNLDQCLPAPGIKSSIKQEPPWRPETKPLSIIQLEGVHRFDDAAKKTIEQFINPVRSTGRSRETAFLEDILHVVQQDLDQRKKKDQNTFYSLLILYLDENGAAAKAAQTYEWVHGKEYLENLLAFPLKLLRSQSVRTVADVAQAVLNNMATVKEEDMPDELCMLLAGMIGRIRSRILRMMEADSEEKRNAQSEAGQHALLHALLMGHFIPKHVAALDNEKRTPAEGKELRELIMMLRSEVIACTCKNPNPEWEDYKLALNKKSQTVLPKFYQAVLVRGKTLLENRLERVVKEKFSPLYFQLIEGLNQGNRKSIIKAAYKLLKAPDGFNLLAVAVGKIKTDEMSDKADFLADLLQNEFKKLSFYQRKALERKLSEPKNLDEIVARLPYRATLFMELDPDLSRDMSATSGLLSQLQEQIRMLDPVKASRSQASIDQADHPMTISPISKDQEMDKDICAAFGVKEIPPDLYQDSSSSSGTEDTKDTEGIEGTEDTEISFSDMLKIDPEELKGKVPGEDDREGKKAKQTQGAPERSKHNGRIMGIKRDKSRKIFDGAVSPKIAASSGVSESKASAPINKGNESGPPYPFSADRPISWKAKTLINDDSPLLPIIGKTKLTMDQLDNVTRRVVEYLINPFRLTGDLSSFLDNASQGHMTARQKIEITQWFNKNALVDLMEITASELSREESSPGKTVDHLLANIFRGPSLPAAAFEALLSFYGTKYDDREMKYKKYTDELLRPAWKMLQTALSARKLNGTSLNINKNNINDEGTAGNVQAIQDIVQFIVKSMIGLKIGETDSEASKDGIRKAIEAVPDKVCMLLSGVTRQVIECANRMLERSEKSKLSPEAFAIRRSEVEAEVRASISAALFMLRSTSPAIVNKAVDLNAEEQGVLILISKILQAIGNGASEQHDPVTQLFSTFIEKCQLPMQQFFAALLARGDALFPQIRVSMDMDLSALRAEEQAAGMALANNIIFALPEAIPLIIQSGRKDFSSLPRDVIVATLLSRR
jgi:hypothetical protein